MKRTQKRWLLPPPFSFPRLITDFFCREEVTGVKTNLKENDGVFDISASKRIADRDLQNTPTIFECELGIKDTDYKRKKSIIYYPGKNSFD